MLRDKCKWWVSKRQKGKKERTSFFNAVSYLDCMKMLRINNEYSYTSERMFHDVLNADMKTFLSLSLTHTLSICLICCFIIEANFASTHIHARFSPQQCTERANLSVSVCECAREEKEITSGKQLEICLLLLSCSLTQSASSP